MALELVTDFWHLTAIKVIKIRKVRGKLWNVKQTLSFIRCVYPVDMRWITNPSKGLNIHFHSSHNFNLLGMWGCWGVSKQTEQAMNFSPCSHGGHFPLKSLSGWEVNVVLLCPRYPKILKHRESDNFPVDQQMKWWWIVKIWRDSLPFSSVGRAGDPCTEALSSLCCLSLPPSLSSCFLSSLRLNCQ